MAFASWSRLDLGEASGPADRESVDRAALRSGHGAVVDGGDAVRVRRSCGGPGGVPGRVSHPDLLDNCDGSFFPRGRVLNSLIGFGTGAPRETLKPDARCGILENGFCFGRHW